ncbi:MAG TPA: hypothetical protein VFZ30_07430 [Acidimicrobiales bacterium]
MLCRPLLAALSLLVVVGVSACQVRTTVTLDVADDGSGTVEVAVDLDAEAVARLPDLDGNGVSDAADLAALARDDDLVAAGWTVEGPETGDDGGVRLQATRAFGTPAEAERVLAELTGPSGALRDLHVTRSESFGSTRIRFAGTADLSGGLEAFGDEGLAAALEGEALGEDATAIEERLGQPLADAFTLEVTAVLAGEQTSWSPRLGDAPLDMRSDSTRYDWPVLGLALVAVLCFGASAAVLVVRVVRSRGRADRA